MKKSLTSLVMVGLTFAVQASEPVQVHAELPKAKAMFSLLKDVLPPEEKVIGVLQNHPKVREARLKTEARQVQSMILRESPHEWEVGAAFRNRKNRTANAISANTNDQEIGLSRNIRLPNKKRIHLQQAERVEALGKYELGDALHEASLTLGENWLECQRLESRAALYNTLENEIQGFATQQMKRFKAGEVARIDANQADLLLQQIRIEKQQNATLLTNKRLALRREFPGLTSPNGVRQCGQPIGGNHFGASPSPGVELTAEEQQTWIKTMLAFNHPLLIQTTQTELLRRQLLLAGADRLADPRLGVSMAREQDNAEQIIGFQVSLPFGGSSRNNQLQLVGRELEQAEVALEALQNVSRDEASQLMSDWEQAKQVASAAWSQSNFAENLLKSLEKAYWLGETTATELTLSRQQAQRSRMEAIDREYDALQMQIKLLINAHQVWD